MYKSNRDDAGLYFCVLPNPFLITFVLSPAVQKFLTKNLYLQRCWLRSVVSPFFRLPACPHRQNCLILIFNNFLDDIRLKFWPFALSVRGYRAFTLLTLSTRETIPAECASNRLTVEAGRTNRFYWADSRLFLCV